MIMKKVKMVERTEMDLARLSLGHGDQFLLCFGLPKLVVNGVFFLASRNQNCSLLSVIK